MDYALRELKRKEAVKDILKLDGIFEHGGWEDPYSPEATGMPECGSLTFVDSSVWINVLSAKRAPGDTELLKELLADDRVATGDYIIHEVLRGVSKSV